MKLKANVIDSTGKTKGEISLPESIFGLRPHDDAMYEAVIMQRASARQGTAKVKERSEVRGGGKKPYKQKGTGSARQGTIRSPLMVGGGRTFGPRPRDYSYRIPRKIYGLALRSALSQKQNEGKVYVFEKFDLKKPETQVLKKIFGNLKIEKALVVDQKNLFLEKSVRNIARSKYLEDVTLNVFDILKYEHLLISSSALKSLEGRLAP